MESSAHSRSGDSDDLRGSPDEELMVLRQRKRQTEVIGFNPSQISGISPTANDTASNPHWEPVTPQSDAELMYLCSKQFPNPISPSNHVQCPQSQRMKGTKMRGDKTTMCSCNENR